MTKEQEAQMFWFKVRSRSPLFGAAVLAAFVAGSIAKGVGIPLWTGWQLGDVYDISLFTGFVVWWAGMFIEGIIVAAAITVIQRTQPQINNNPRSKDNG